MVGDVKSGKSDILSKIVQEGFEGFKPTISLDYGLKFIEINNKIYKIIIWDTAGSEIFQAITRTYYKNATCAILVYDITNKISFEHLPFWIDEVQKNSLKTIVKILVGHKKDLENKREVSYIF